MERMGKNIKRQEETRDEEKYGENGIKVKRMGRNIKRMERSMERMGRNMKRTEEI